MTMEYNFDKRIQSGKFDIRVDSAAQYGYFEHDDLGEERGGGLWFEANDLIDYDGVAVLPKAVREGLRSLGFTVGEE